MLSGINTGTTGNTFLQIYLNFWYSVFLHCDTCTQTTTCTDTFVTSNTVLIGIYQLHCFFTFLSIFPYKCIHCRSNSHPAKGLNNTDFVYIEVIPPHPKEWRLINDVVHHCKSADYSSQIRLIMAGYCSRILDISSKIRLFFVTFLAISLILLPTLSYN